MLRLPLLTSLTLLFLSLPLTALPPALADAPTADNTARFLAGIKPDDGSVMAPYAKEGAWARHARTLDQSWDRLEKSQLSRIRAWSKKYLPESRDFMLYMFSGPDFLYADAFYPNAKTYVLAGLEPVGPIPDLTKMSANGRAAALQELNSSIYTVLQYSFFITKDMKAKLRTGQLVGTIPVLYVFLARAGKTVEDVTLVNLNPDGTVTPSEGATPKGSSSGVKIDFSDGGPQKKTLYYFSTDLSDGGLKASGYTKFCDSLGPADSLIKSASYLLHSGNFSTARDYLLAKSAALVQDDSGVPLRYFDRKKWQLQPFGRYAGPISIFAGRYQNDMAQLFAKGRATAIDFGIGYRWRTHETNVLLAKNLELTAAMAAQEAAAKAAAEKAAAEKVAAERAAAEKIAAEKAAAEKAAAEKAAAEKAATETPAATPASGTAAEQKPQ
ncbi:MAG: hypothetical protein VX871_05920 [Pseudomonadota bacterium]|nr:hypothetical protein [Pseudomonadota bacterium]